MSYRKLLFTILFLLAIDSYASVVTVSTHVHDMEFRDLARKWDEAIPLGNATIGSLIWQKGERLRTSWKLKGTIYLLCLNGSQAKFRRYNYGDKKRKRN